MPLSPGTRPHVMKAAMTFSQAASRFSQHPLLGVSFAEPEPRIEVGTITPMANGQRKCTVRQPHAGAPQSSQLQRLRLVLRRVGDEPYTLHQPCAVEAPLVDTFHLCARGHASTCAYTQERWRECERWQGGAGHKASSSMLTPNTTSAIVLGYRRAGVTVQNVSKHFKLLQLFPVELVKHPRAANQVQPA